MVFLLIKINLFFFFLKGRVSRFTGFTAITSQRTAGQTCNIIFNQKMSEAPFRKICHISSLITRLCAVCLNIFDQLFSWF